MTTDSELKRLRDGFVVATEWTRYSNNIPNERRVYRGRLLYVNVNTFEWWCPSATGYVQSGSESNLEAAKRVAESWAEMNPVAPFDTVAAAEAAAAVIVEQMDKELFQKAFSLGTCLGTEHLCRLINALQDEVRRRPFMKYDPATEKRRP